MPKPNSTLSPKTKDAIVRLAWHDRTSFEVIEKTYGLPEAEVIRLMRRELKPASFCRWRERVSGRITKHRKRFEQHLRRRSIDT